MEKLGKESIKGVSGGNIVLFRDKNGEITWLLFNAPEITGEIKWNQLRDIGEDGCVTKFWADEGKFLKSFIDDAGVEVYVTPNIEVVNTYAEQFGRRL